MWLHNLLRFARYIATQHRFMSCKVCYFFFDFRFATNPCCLINGVCIVHLCNLQTSLLLSSFPLLLLARRQKLCLPPNLSFPLTSQTTTIPTRSFFLSVASKKHEDIRHPWPHGDPDAEHVICRVSQTAYRST